MNWVTCIVIQSICWQGNKKPKNVHKEGNTCLQRNSVRPKSQNPSSCLYLPVVEFKYKCFIQCWYQMWRLRFHRLHLQDFSTEQRVPFGGAVSRERQFDGCTGAEVLRCTCREGLGPRQAPGLPPSHAGDGQEGRMIDEDVQLQLDHQFSG